MSGVNNVKPLNPPALSRCSLCCPYPSLYPQVINWLLITQASYTDSLLHFNVGSQFKCGCTGAAIIKHLSALSKQLCCITLTLAWRFKKNALLDWTPSICTYIKKQDLTGMMQTVIIVEIVTKHRSFLTILHICMHSGIYQRSRLMKKVSFTVGYPINLLADIMVE